MATQTLSDKGGELVISFESFAYCFTSAKLKNPEVSDAATLAEVVGQPVKKVSTDWVLMLATDEANAIGIVVQGPAISALAAGESTTEKYLILTLGPAVVNQDVQAAADYEGTSFTNATVRTALGALAPKILFVSEPTKTEEGTD